MIRGGEQCVLWAGIVANEGGAPGWDITVSIAAAPGGTVTTHWTGGDTGG